MNHIKAQIDDHVMTITFDRPAKRNAFTHAMYQDLVENLDQAAGDDDVRVVILTGGENCFTGGNDLNDFFNNPPKDEHAPVFQFLNRISTFPKPLVSAIAGHATGVGVTMLLHCDLNIAATNALFSTPFINLAVVPEAASSLLMPLAMGHHRAARFFLLADVLDARTALEYGLVMEVVPEGEVVAKAAEIARRMAQKPPLAMQLAKKLMKGDLYPAIEKRMNEESLLFKQQMFSPEAREAFAAFLQKRPARF